MLIDEAFSEILNKPTIWGFIQLLGPVWIAFFLGVMAGWAWKPRRDILGNYKFEFSLPSSPYSASIQNSNGSNVNSPMLSNRFRQNSNRLNINLNPPVLSKGFGQNSNGLNVNSPMLSKGFGQNSNGFNVNSPMLSNGFGQKEQMGSLAIDDDDNGPSPSKLGKDETSPVTDEDLEHFSRLVEKRDGGPPWKHIMDRSTHSMSYQAWQRDPEGGPPQYCSRTVYEDATPEMLRDFFWDDEFRLEWDDMIIDSTVLEECPITGAMVVHWTRKFPFFCSDREYIVARRIWESGRSYYCVTKGVPCLSVPRRDKPRRVDLFYSSWFIQAVESSEGDACEVILFHYEDMGISHGITKFGVRQGMWGAVKSVERGFRAYQAHRASGADLSHYALFAQINTRLDPNYSRSRILEDSESEGSSSGTNSKALAHDDKPKGGMNLPKLLVMGGALTMAFNLDRGLLMKMVIFGVVRKLGNIGRGN